MKYLIKIILACFLSVSLVQGFWLFKNGGLISIYFQNQSDRKKEIPIEASLSGGKIFMGELESDEIIPKQVVLRFGLGTFDLTIIRKDNNLQVTEKINIFSVTWITVDIYSDEIVVEKHLTPPLFQ